jgi:hypothetical protein
LCLDDAPIFDAEVRDEPIRIELDATADRVFCFCLVSGMVASVQILDEYSAIVAEGMYLAEEQTPE